MAVPGGLLLLGWLAGVFQLRHVLVHGDVTVGVVHRIVRVPLVLPEMLRVDYTFRDHRAVTRQILGLFERLLPAARRAMEEEDAGEGAFPGGDHDRGRHPAAAAQDAATAGRQRAAVGDCRAADGA